MSEAPLSTPRETTTDDARDQASPEPSRPFPIVGLGASAGGLEALEQFLAKLPQPCGMALVVIQHLDPTRKGLMPELLQRATPLSVCQAEDGMRVRPDNVYVIPPNKDMSILHGVLHLFEPSVARGLRLPIDFFLRSLALDQKQNSVGVILSGMGSDGTLGLAEIKEKEGLTLAQEPSSARFDSMPRSAIDAGHTDIVAPVEELPGRIQAYLNSPGMVRKAEQGTDPKTQNGLEKILILLRARAGHDFSAYKKNTLYRRIERRMCLHQIDQIGAYVRYLQENPQELDLLFKELLIGVTSFFRDPAAWAILGEKVLPALLANCAPGPWRAWVAGCSTGEEAYSLAIAVREAAETLVPKKAFKFQIFASDLDRDAIDRARTGVFLENISADVSPERLSRFFTKEESGYRIRSEIREMVIFSPHSVILDPPFTKLDFLSCRNLLIYLSAEMQKRLFPIFHYSLKPDGALFLGSAETVSSEAKLFTAIDGKSRLFRRIETVLKTEPIDFPASFAAPVRGGTDPEAQRRTRSPQSLQSLAEQHILGSYAPPTVLVDENGNILHISGRTGNYLEPAAGKANWNIFAMAREGLRHELSEAFHKALGQQGPVCLRGLKISLGEASQWTDLSVEKLASSEPLGGLVMIVFTKAAAPTEPKTKRRAGRPGREGPRLAELEQELRGARAELQRSREEMQASQEELRSANEELQSTNEEMQSTNEELTTSKEEMQSLNEELQTVNAELQNKVDELSRSNNDMKNLLNSTDVATLFLDERLNVRRFTTSAVKIIKLIPGDVGRPITDLATELHYPELADDAREVLIKLGSKEKPIRARDGRWFSARIMPYRTADNRIDGVVVTFWDISASKQLEEELRSAKSGLESRLAGHSPESGPIEPSGEHRASNPPSGDPARDRDEREPPSS